MGSAFLSTQLVEEVLESYREELEGDLASDRFDRDGEEHRTGVYVVVLGRSNYPWARASFGILEGGHEHDEIALRKAEMSIRENMDTSAIAEDSQLLMEGDVACAGGVFFGSFAVGVGGHFSDIDGQIAAAIGERIIDDCTDLLLEHQESGVHFIGKE